LKPLTTTTIGSFPLPPGIEEFKRSLKLQVEAGVDYPALPQLEDFCEIFLRDIAERGKGLKRQGEQYVLVGPIEPPREPSIVQEAVLAINTLKEMGVQGRLKVQVTGPLTLSSLVKFLDKNALAYPDIVESFADAIGEIVACACSHEEVEVAFIDEPMTYYALWSGYEDKFVVNCLNRALRKVPKGVERGIHICGDARGLHRVTLNLDVDVIHHEVAGSPQNLDAYTPSNLVQSGKMLGIGVVTVKPLDERVRIEEVEEIEKLMVQAAEKYQGKVVFAPDCGFKGLLEALPIEQAVQVVYEKLSNMVKASAKLKERFAR